MRAWTTLFIKIVIVLVAIVALAALIWEPQTEGRNVNADQFSIYFRDPFLAYAYLASIPFFVALYQAFKLVGYIGQKNLISQISVRTLRNIKYCTLAFSGLIALGLLYLRLFTISDDPAGFTALSLLTIFASIVVASAAAVFQRRLQHAVDLHA